MGYQSIYLPPGTPQHLVFLANTWRR